MSEWRETTIGDVITLQRGFDIRQLDQSPGSIPVISSSGTTSYHDEYKAEGPGVLVGRKGTLGTVFYVEGNYWPHSTSLWVKDFKGNNPRFIYYFLHTFDLKAHDVGSSNPTLNRNHVHLFQCSVPTVQTQSAIAEVLSSLDDKIDLLTRQNVTLEALAQTYFRQWFVEENKNDNITVSQIASLLNNSVNPAHQPLEPFEHYSIPAFDNAQTPAIELGKSILSNKFIVPPNCILVSKLNPITPRIWRIGDNVKANSVCSTEFQVLKPHDNEHYLFLYFLMKSNDVVSSFIMSATGTSGSHQRIRPEYILEVETPEPDKDKLRLFNEICTPMMERVKINSKQVLTLQKLRDTLLPKLISGEVRVKR